MIPAWTLIVPVTMAVLGISWDTFLILRVKRDLHDIAKDAVGTAAKDIGDHFQSRLDGLLAPLLAIAKKFGVEIEGLNDSSTTAKHNDTPDRG